MANFNTCRRRAAKLFRGRRAAKPAGKIERQNKETPPEIINFRRRLKNSRLRALVNARAQVKS
jgi:hypothetical protein